MKTPQKTKRNPLSRAPQKTQKQTARKTLLSKLFSIKIGRFLYLNIWFIPTLAAAYFGRYLPVFLLSFACALLHELAHVLCAHLLKVGIKEIVVYPFGICARLKAGYIKSSAKEFFIAFSGPFFSFLLYAAFAVLYSVFPHSHIRLFSDINLALCAVNLIPCLPLDGGRMLKSLLSERFGIIRSYNFTVKLSKVLTVFLLTFSFFVLKQNGFNFSLLLIGAFLLNQLCTEQQAICKVMLSEICSCKQKLSREARCRIICVNEKTPARTILKRLTYDCVYIVHIADKNAKIIKTVTEIQILSALTSQGIQICYGDIPE